ncbi:unnamed protein product [Clonostachys solani]|uniref:FAD-binding domain-containing protein n=1 Tax=Clonostachys solani TaxID=160281 RepID=A0A9P0EHN0_9HYPO|nr:unnamed protein product [Clonostachys solani]
MQAEARSRALIIGAGISGLAAAWWLEKAGWACTIVEKSPSMREGGYIVSISGSGLETVKRMGLYEKLDEISYNFDENVVKDNGGRELLRLRYKDVHGGVDALAVCRDDLARVLANAISESVAFRFGDTVVKIEDDGTKAQATLSTGETLEADLLIGADGIRSSTRNYLCEGNKCLEDLGYTYAVYDIEGQPGLDSDCVSFNSPGHLDVLYTLRNNRVAALHIWRDDQTRLQDKQSQFDKIRHITSGSTKLVTDVISLAERNGSTPVVDRLTMVSLPNWHKGRVLLLGDAAHCLTLMSGQGAGMALASAEILGKELMSTNIVATALSQHERKLRPIIERLQQRSRKMAAMYIPKNTFMYHLRNFFLRFMPYSWIVSWHASSAKSEIDSTLS